MISLPHILVKTYGGLATSGEYRASGTGGGTSGPPKPPKAPVQDPKKPEPDRDEDPSDEDE